MVEALRETTYGTQTATRGITVLAALAAAGRPLRLREVIDRAGITKSAAHRILAELGRQEFVTRTPDNVYEIGPATVALAARVLRDDALRLKMRPVLEELGAITFETVTLHLRTGDNRVCVDTVESPYPIRRVVALGQTLPLYVAPTGKVILALLPPSEQDRILAASELEPDAVAAVRRQLDLLGAHGYIAAEGDRIAGVGTFSFALTRDHRPVASITISGPTSRWSLEAMSAVLPAVRDACAHIEPWTATVVRWGGSELLLDQELTTDVELPSDLPRGAAN